jgi:hypothetical protein
LTNERTSPYVHATSFDPATALRNIVAPHRDGRVDAKTDATGARNPDAVAQDGARNAPQWGGKRR